MPDAAVTAASVAASANAIKSLTETFGASITQGQVVYRDSSGKLQLSDANGASAAKAVLGITLNAGSDTQPAAVVTEDSDFNPGFLATEGVIYVLSATAGGIAPAADLASGMQAIVLGIGKSNGNLNLKITAGGALA